VTAFLVVPISPIIDELYSRFSHACPFSVGRVEWLKLAQQKQGMSLSIEECKKYIGNLNLTDKQIEEVRDILYAFIEQALDYSIDSGIVTLSQKQPCQLIEKDLTGQKKKN
jgi:hypothetical protein